MLVRFNRIEALDLLPDGVASASDSKRPRKVCWVWRFMSGLYERYGMTPHASREFLI
jgi:hypothetical protein